MKHIAFIISLSILFASCDTTSKISGLTNQTEKNTDTLITQSLFNASAISEDSIQKILDDNYKLPEKLDSPHQKLFQLS
jgi:hypothetical protein